jgi:uncharacterized SAM-binding protein YcdF (DUF218 family)
MIFPTGRSCEDGSERGGIILRLIFLLFVIVILLVLYLIHNPLLRFAGNFWVVDESPQHSDAIIVLGDDNYNGDRAARAAELFKAGWAPYIVASGRYLRPYASVAELIQRDLTDRGVPPSAILRFSHRAENTREEAFALSQLISSRGWKRILLVTSNYHTRRAEFIFGRALPEGIELRVVAAHDSQYDPENWWHTRRGVKTFFSELVGSLVALWEMRQSDVRTSGSVQLRPARPCRVVA